MHGFKRTVTDGFIWSVLRNTVMEVNGFKRTVDGFKRTVRAIIVLVLDRNGFKRTVNGFKRTVTRQDSGWFQKESDSSKLLFSGH